MPCDLYQAILCLVTYGSYLRSCILCNSINNSPIYHSSTKTMKLNFINTILVATVVGTAFEFVQAAGIAACTKNKDGTGPYDADSTEYCCFNVHGLYGGAAYSEKYGDCRTGVVNGNNVDQGRMTECCSNEGKGSVAQ